MRQLAVGGSFFEWLDDGESVVGLDSGRSVHVIIDVGLDDAVPNSRFAPWVTSQRTAFVEPVGDGQTILVQRDVGVVSLYNVQRQLETPFPGPPGLNVSFVFSPDGRLVAYNNVVGEHTNLMLAHADGSNAIVLREDAGVWDENWSPDGQWLLIHAGKRYEVIDLQGTTVYALAVPETAGVFSEEQWAGPHRLLLTQSGDADNGSPEAVASKFVDIPSGIESPAPPEFAIRFVSISPDGRHAIMRRGDGAAWEQRCALVEIDPGSGTISESVSKEATPADFQTVFCTTVDWTADSTKAIVSAGGI